VPQAAKGRLAAISSVRSLTGSGLQRPSPAFTAAHGLLAALRRRSKASSLRILEGEIECVFDEISSLVEPIERRTGMYRPGRSEAG
jgi:hypothetical protein